MSLRRVNLVRWLPYMDECIEILEKSPDALPSDKTMVRWAKLAQIIEEIYVQFASDDIPSVVSFSDPKSLYTLKALEKQLEQWKRETLPEHSSRKQSPTPSSCSCAHQGDQLSFNKHTALSTSTCTKTPCMLIIARTRRGPPGMMLLVLLAQHTSVPSAPVSLLSTKPSIQSVRLTLKS